MTASRQPARHVVVMGLMGTGKTTVGHLLAAGLGWPMHDSDPEIEAAEGRTVRQLRDEVGVDSMHDIEARQLLGALATDGPSVICPAASVVDDTRCRAALADPAVAVVWLTASPAVAAARFPSGAHRPWYGDDPKVFLAQQAAERYPRFRALAAVHVDTDVLAPEAVAAQARDALRALGALPTDADEAGARYEHRPR
jgi:shikimate kinase